MLTYEEFEILMDQYDERMNEMTYAMFNRMGDYSEQLENVDDARTRLKNDYPEYVPIREKIRQEKRELFRLAVESDHDYLDIPFLEKSAIDHLDIAF